MEEDNLEGYTLDSSLIEDENLNLSNIAKYSNDIGDELIESKEDQPKETKPIPVPDETFVKHTEKSSDTNSRPLSGFKPNYMSSTKTSSSTRVVRASTPESSRMKFGMTEYQSSRPNSRPASPALSVSSTGSRTGRVTPRRERITNVVSPLSLEDINVSLGLGLTSLKGLGVKKDLKILYLQNNYLTSFKHLESQPNLEVIYAANNCISSFYGLCNQPKLKLISLEGNPITKHPNYRLMVLIAVGSWVKKIDGELVQHKEREYVKQYIAANEKCVQAIRAGWLMDTTPRTSEDFDNIITELSQTDMDDRVQVRNSQIFKDLVEGALTKTVQSVDWSQFEPRKPEKKEEVDVSSESITSSSGTFNASFLNNYANEIKNLKAQLEKKNEQLKQENEKFRELKETSLGLEEIAFVNSFDILNVSVSLNSSADVIDNVSVSFSQERMDVSLGKNLLRSIEFSKVSRTSLLVDENKLFRIHIRLSNSDLLDVITQDKKRSLALYKIIHMKIAFFNKQKKQKTASEK